MFQSKQNNSFKKILNNAKNKESNDDNNDFLSEYIINSDKVEVTLNPEIQNYYKKHKKLKKMMNDE